LNANAFWFYLNSLYFPAQIDQILFSNSETKESKQEIINEIKNTFEKIINKISFYKPASKKNILMKFKKMFLNDIYSFLQEESEESDHISGLDKLEKFDDEKLERNQKNCQEKFKENFNLLEKFKFLESEKNLQILENITKEGKNHKNLSNEEEEGEKKFLVEIENEKCSSKDSFNMHDSNTQVCSSSENKIIKNEKTIHNLDLNSNFIDNPIVIDLEKLENLESCENFEILINDKKDSKSQSHTQSSDENIEIIESNENTISISLHSTPDKEEINENSQKTHVSENFKVEVTKNKEEQKKFLVTNSNIEKFEKNSQITNFFSKTTNINGNLILPKSKILIENNTPVKINSNNKNNNLLNLVKSPSLLNNTVLSKDIYKTRLDDIISKMESKLSQITQKNKNLFSHLNSKINTYKNFFPSNLKIDTSLYNTKKEVLINTYLISQEKEKYFKLVKDRHDEKAKKIITELNLSCGGKIPILKSYKEEVELENKENQIREAKEEIHPTCKVCNNADYEDQDLFIFCVECNISIHASCYGVSIPIPIEDFVCDVCKKFSLSDGENLECLLCPVKGGAMKKCILKPNSNFYNNIMNLKKGEICEKKNNPQIKNTKPAKNLNNEKNNKNVKICKKTPKKSSQISNNKISKLNFDSPISLKSSSQIENNDEADQPDRTVINDLNNLSSNTNTNTKITSPNSHTFTFSIFNSTQNCSNISHTSNTSLIENNLTNYRCKNPSNNKSKTPSNNQSRDSVNTSETNNLDELSNFSLNEQEIENINDIVNNTSDSKSDSKSEKNINCNDINNYSNESLEECDISEHININTDKVSLENTNGLKNNRLKSNKAPHKKHSNVKSDLISKSTTIKQPKTSKNKNIPAISANTKNGKITTTSPQSAHIPPKSQPEAWVHLSCALWNPEVDIGDFYRKSEIRNLENIDKSRFKELCSICKLANQGPTLKCAATNCNSNSICTTRFHVECARINKYCFETLNIKGTLQYNIYCQKHQQNKFIKLLETRKMKVLDEIIEYKNILSKIYTNHEREYETNPLDFHKSILYSGEGNIQQSNGNNLKSNNCSSNFDSKNNNNAGKKIKLGTKGKFGTLGKENYKDTSIKYYALKSNNNKNGNAVLKKNNFQLNESLNPNEINYPLVASKMGLQERCNFVLQFKHLCKLYSNPNTVVLKKIKIVPGSENYKTNPLIQSLYPPVINLETISEKNSIGPSQNSSTHKSTRSSLNPAPTPQFKYEFDLNTFKNKLKFEDIVKCKDFPWEKVSYKNFTKEQVKNLFFALVPDEITYNRRILKRKNKHKNVVYRVYLNLIVSLGQGKNSNNEDKKKKVITTIKEKSNCKGSGGKIDPCEKNKNDSPINLIGIDDMIIDLIDADYCYEKENINFGKQQITSIDAQNYNKNEFDDNNQKLLNSNANYSDEKNQYGDEAATVALNSQDYLDDVDMDIDYNEEFNFEPEEEGAQEVYCYCQGIDDGSIMISKYIKIIYFYFLKTFFYSF
jgi:hypothetical protein